jgi:hypothetical protein
MSTWFDAPYEKGPPVGPDKVPRVLSPPSAGKGTFTGPDAMAVKRGISRAQRFDPWAPLNWDYTYGEVIALGRGTGQVGDSGVRGFQRQEFPLAKAKHTGIVNEETYQRMRRALVPVGPNEGDPIFDPKAVDLLFEAAKEYAPLTDIQKVREAIVDFTRRAEAHEAVWHYSQRRPYTGLGDAPELKHWGDCSSYVILCYYWARQVTRIRVPDPSGYQYAGWGNTWDNLDGHPRVTSGSYQVGDLAHYSGHVTICRKAGDYLTSVWSSFGSESGPDDKDLHYSGDFIKVVRPPLLP